MPDNSKPAFEPMLGTDAAGEKDMTESVAWPRGSGELFDCFASAFEAFDPAKVAELFAIPSVTLRKDGSIVAL